MHYMDGSLKCTTTTVLYKSPIECPDCNRDYAIYEIQHECNVIAPCDIAKRSYREQYISVVDAPRKPRITCEVCTTRKAKPPRKGKCPQCQFVGFYTFGPDRLCPSCVNSAKPVVELGKATTQITSAVDQSPIHFYKLPAKVFFRFGHDDIAPNDNAVNNACVMIITSQESADKLFDVVVAQTDTVRKFIADLQKTIGEMRAQYDLLWQNTGTESWEWLKFFYRKYADPALATL